MQSKHLPITFAEFKLIPHPFGWKAEYYNDKAHLTPRHNHIKTKLSLQPKIIKTKHSLKKIDPSYKPQMITAFYESFYDSVEFCDWETADIQKHAEKNINDYFNNVRGQALTDSIMIIEPKNNQIIGLALFLINPEQNYELDLLFVSPQYQRQGLSSEMVVTVSNQLYETGIHELYSYYHIGNDLSRHWHQSFGFKEEYDQHFIRLKYTWHCEEIRRLEKLDLTTKLAPLIKEKDYWYSQIDQDRHY